MRYGVNKILPLLITSVLASQPPPIFPTGNLVDFSSRRQFYLPTQVCIYELLKESLQRTLHHLHHL